MPLFKGAERFLSAWHGRPSIRERVRALAEATGEDERADMYGSGERIERLDHGLHGRTVGDPNGLITLTDLESIREPVGALLLELPQRELGGLLPGWDVSRHRRVGRASAGIAGLFERVCLLLQGPRRARRRRARGGPRRHLRGTCVATAPRRQRRHAASFRGRGGAGTRRAARPRRHVLPACARRAAALVQMDGIEVVPNPPQTPLFHVLMRGDRERLSDAALSVAEERKVFLFANPHSTTSPAWQRHEVMVGDATIRLTPDEVRDLYAEVIARATQAP